MIQLCPAWCDPQTHHGVVDLLERSRFCWPSRMFSIPLTIKINNPCGYWIRGSHAIECVYLCLIILEAKSGQVAFSIKCFHMWKETRNVCFQVLWEPIEMSPVLEWVLLPFQSSHTTNRWPVTYSLLGNISHVLWWEKYQNWESSGNAEQNVRLSSLYMRVSCSFPESRPTQQLFIKSLPCKLNYRRVIDTNQTPFSSVNCCLSS